MVGCGAECDIFGFATGFETKMSQSRDIFGFETKMSFSGVGWGGQSPVFPESLFFNSKVRFGGSKMKI